MRERGGSVPAATSRQCMLTQATTSTLSSSEYTEPPAPLQGISSPHSKGSQAQAVGRAFHRKPCTPEFEFRAPSTPRARPKHHQNATKTPQNQRHLDHEVFTTSLVQRIGAKSAKSGSCEGQQIPTPAVAGIRPADQYVAPRPFSGPGMQDAQNAKNPPKRHGTAEV